MRGEYLGGLADELDRDLADADAELARRYPGAAPGRQPVHTVYVPADRYHRELAHEWGTTARDALSTHGGAPKQLADATGLPEPDVADVYDRVVAKLEREPIEDLRIDFEDGYGRRDDAEETAAARAAARELAQAQPATPFAGIRFKSLEAPTRRRALSTLDTFLGELGPPPPGFRLTLPKVTSVDQVTAMVKIAQRLEQAHGLAANTLRFEIQIETPQAVLGPDGTALVARMVRAAGGRAVGLHYGTYDYSAALGIAAAYQSMEHPAADHAKAVMQLAAAGTSVHLSDGSTNVLPTGDPATVRDAWRLHARLVRRSLERGFYQGWDLHPAQLPTRYLAVFTFFRAGLSAAAARLKAYAERAESGFLDEPATARALAGFLRRSCDCGAVDESDVTELTGLDRAALDGYAGQNEPQ